MKRTVLIAAVTALFVAPAFADSIVIAPEVQTQFKEFVVKEKVKPVTIEEAVEIGATLPETVVLEPVPDVIIEANPDFRSYQYAYLGDEIVLVDPDTRAGTANHRAGSGPEALIWFRG
jgi:hypothetical protein